MSGAEMAVELVPGAHALFTDRSHGNVSSVGGDGAEDGSDARERVRRLAGVRRLARGHQVHGAVVARIGSVTEAESDAGPPSGADGQATALTGVGAMVLTADCMPVALGCDGAVAMLHAGWRGMAAGVLEEGVRVLRELGCDGPIVAVAGPAAGVCCYEVGPEVHDALGARHARGSHIDLRAVAHERLLAAGAAEVRDVDACTICDERFFSHRREGARAGRQVGVAWLS